MIMMIVPMMVITILTMMMTTAAHPGGELQNIGQLFPAAQTVHHRFPVLLFYLKEKSLFSLFFFRGNSGICCGSCKGKSLLLLFLKSGGGVDILVVVGVIPIIFVLNIIIIIIITSLENTSAWCSAVISFNFCTCHDHHNNYGAQP